jgi:hypothetical protein
MFFRPGSPLGTMLLSDPGLLPLSVVRMCAKPPPLSPKCPPTPICFGGGGAPYATPSVDLQPFQSSSHRSALIRCMHCSPFGCAHAHACGHVPQSPLTYPSHPWSPSFPFACPCQNWLSSLPSGTDWFPFHPIGLMDLIKTLSGRNAIGIRRIRSN